MFILKIGHRFHAPLKVCSDPDDIVPLKPFCDCKGQNQSKCLYTCQPFLSIHIIMECLKLERFDDLQAFVYAAQLKISLDAAQNHSVQINFAMIY